MRCHNNGVPNISEGSYARYTNSFMMTPTYSNIARIKSLGIASLMKFKALKLFILQKLVVESFHLKRGSKNTPI